MDSLRLLHDPGACSPIECPHVSDQIHEFFFIFACRIEKGKHDLILTNFETATYCNFCGKKVRYTCTWA